MLRYGLGALAGAGLMIMASAAWAQSTSVTLADGRTLTAGGPIAQCRPPAISEEPGNVGLDYQCTVPDLDGGSATVAGTGAIMLLPAQGQAGSTEGFLRHTQRQWWPAMAVADLAPLTRESKATANGRIDVVCVPRDNVEALNGDALCIVDQPGIQVIIVGQSTMAYTADNVIDAILSGVTVR